MKFYVMTRTHVRQFTLMHVAKCHSTISWIMSTHLPMCIDRRQSTQLCPRWGSFTAKNESDGIDISSRGAPVVVKTSSSRVVVTPVSTINRTKGINRPCNDLSITSVWLTCWDCLWCRLYRNNMFCWRMPFTLVQIHNFNFIFLLLWFLKLFLIICFFFALPITLIVIVYVRLSATFHIICHQHLSRPIVLAV